MSMAWERGRGRGKGERNWSRAEQGERERPHSSTPGCSGLPTPRSHLDTPAVWCWWSGELSSLAVASPEQLACPPNLAAQGSYSSFQLLLIKLPKRRIRKDSLFLTRREWQIIVTLGIPAHPTKPADNPNCRKGLHTCSFFCSILISEYSCAVARAAANAFFFWLLARLGTEVVMGIGVWTILMGEFSGKSSNYDTGETELLVMSQMSNPKERQCRLRQVLQDREGNSEDWGPLRTGWEEGPF